jgi:NADH-quinone oxidoreductase subunit C
MTDTPEAVAVEPEAPARPAVVEGLLARFPDADCGASADAIPFVRIPVDALGEAALLLRDQVGYARFVDLTVVDYPERDDRFELQVLVYSMAERAWVRLKARTAEAAPSLTAIFPAANWFEREAFDLFGVRFDGHPDLTRLMLPDDWQGHPLRRDHAVGGEPVDFTVTREIYGT